MARAKSPRQYTGVRAIIPPDTIRNERSPTTADLAFQFNTLWVDVPNNDVYMYTNSASGVANWTLLGSSSSSITDVPHGGTDRATLTDHAIIVGSGTAAVDFVGPGATGTILQGAGASADPAFSTATYPSVATGSGTFLRANGTNWLASTATIPNTAVQGDLLYASANETWTSLAKNATQGMMLTNNGASSAPIWQPSPAGLSEGWSNLGMSLSGGILSIVGETGTVISATNSAVVKFNSKDVPGTIKTIVLTAAPVGLTASQLTTATFGTTASVAWANAMPFFIYAVINDAETGCSFFCSRNPCAQVTPSTVYKEGTVGSVTGQRDFYGFDTGATSADYQSQPCVRVGSFRMVKSAGDAWTIQTLGTGNGGIGDGIGNYDENTYWVFPTGQNGANSTEYFSSEDATDPSITLSTGNYTYQLGNDGSCDIFMGFASTTVGSGASSLRFHLPYDTNAEANISSPPGYFRYSTTIGNAQNIFMCLRDNVSSGDPAWYTVARISDGVFLIANDFAATISNISADLTYQAFSGNG